MLAIALVVGASPALADEPSRCHAAAQPGESYTQVAADWSRWSCRPSEVDHRPQTTFVRFGLNDGARPASFVSRIGRYSRIELTAIDGDGAQRTHRFALETRQLFVVRVPQWPVGETLSARVGVDRDRNAAHLDDPPP